MSSRFDDAICGCCGRSATGLGYAPKAGKSGGPPPPVLWTCGATECLQFAKETYGMKPDTFSRIEALAAVEGGRALESYCDEIGKSDFREFTEAEFHEANRRMISGYRDALKVKLRDEAPF